METFKVKPRIDPPTSAEDLLETGLLDYWYMVLPASEVADRPVAVTRLNRNIVLWRSQTGDVQAVENYCPHRGAPLSRGYVCDGMLVCPYHGLQLDGQGIIASTPPTPDSPFVGQRAIRSYPCREFAGAIWVYFSDDENKDVPEPVFPEEITSDEWSSFLFTTEWNTNWQVAMDNRLDPVHGSYLHSGSFTLSYGRKDAELKIKETEHGFHTWRTNQSGVNIDWHEVTFIPDNIFWVRTEIPYPKSLGATAFRINAHPTPIDRDRTYVWFYRSAKVSGWKRDMWRFLYRNRLEERNFYVVEQDREVLEAIPVEARKREMLLQTDIAVARFRRMLRLEAERRFAELERASRNEAAE